MAHIRAAEVVSRTFPQEGVAFKTRILLRNVPLPTQSRTMIVPHSDNSGGAGRLSADSGPNVSKSPNLGRSLWGHILAELFQLWPELEQICGDLDQTCGELDFSESAILAISAAFGRESTINFGPTCTPKLHLPELDRSSAMLSHPAGMSGPSCVAERD